MQIEIEKSVSEMTEHEQVSLYRTKWLLAHNRLHDVTQEHSDLLKGDWEKYLQELQSSDAVASQAA